jgi:hypothetical protein
VAGWFNKAGYLSDGISIWQIQLNVKTIVIIKLIGFLDFRMVEQPYLQD